MTAPPEGPASREAQQGLRATTAGILANVILAGVKAAAGVVGNSYALIADAIESFADIFSSAIVYTGIAIGSRPPDADHPYGHGKAESLAGVAVSTALAVAGVLIGIQSIREIITPHHSPEPFTLGVLVIVIIIKFVLARRVLAVGVDIGSTAVEADARHHQSDMLTSIAAFIGISISIAGGPAYAAADDGAALLASGVILFNAWRIGRRAFGEVMDEAPSRDVLDRVRSVAADVEGVSAVEKCFVRKMGLSYYADIHIEVEGSLSVREGHLIAHNVQDRLRERVPGFAGALVHVEPKGGVQESE